MMPDIDAFDHEKRVLGNICSVIGDTLQVARDQYQIDGLRDDRRIVLHEGNQLRVNGVFQAIDDIVGEQRRERLPWPSCRRSCSR